MCLHSDWRRRYLRRSSSCCFGAAFGAAGGVSSGTRSDVDVDVWAITTSGGTAVAGSNDEDCS